MVLPAATVAVADLFQWTMYAQKELPAFQEALSVKKRSGGPGMGKGKGMQEKGMAIFSSLLPFLGLLFQPGYLDPDIWFILNGGRYVAEQGIPHVEPFTVHEGLHFVLEQWLTGLVYWEVYDAFGEEGLLALVFLAGALLLHFYYRLCLLVSGGNRQVATLLSLVVGFTACPFFLVTRPQVLSAPLFVLEVCLLERYAREGNPRRLLPLPFLSLLLVNLHAALWPMLFLLVLPYLAACLWGKLELSPPGLPGSRFAGSPLLLAMAGMFLAGFCNPYGWEAMAFLFTSFDGSIHGRISEIQPLSIAGLYGKFFFLWLAVSLVIYGKKRVPVQYLLLFLGTALMAMYAVRNEFLFLVLGTFPLAYACREWKSVFLSGEGGSVLPAVLLLLLWVPAAYRVFFVLEADASWLWGVKGIYLGMVGICLALSFFGPLGKRARSYALLVYAWLILGVSMMQPSPGENFSAEHKETVDFLLEQEAATDILLWTGFNSGAYPEFRGIRCYMDARPEVFLPSNSRKEENIIREYFDLVDGKTYYKDFFRQHGFTHILVMPSDGIPYAMLPHDPDFSMIYEQKDKQGEVVCRLFVPAEK